MRNRERSFCKAFTLVELLVVIMIILVLAGMLMPAINGARKRGRDALCKNNLKQLQVAAMTCAISEGNGALPAAKSTESFDTYRRPNRWIKSATGWVDWVNYAAHDDNNINSVKPGPTPWWGPSGLTCITNGTLWKYVKSTKAYSCQEWAIESVCGKFDPLNVILTFNSTNNVPWRCYGMSQNAGGRNIGDLEASKLVLFTELSNTNKNGALNIAQWSMKTPYTPNLTPVTGTECHGWDGMYSGNIQSLGIPNENVGQYHSGKANAVFVDGHIEALTWVNSTNAYSGNW